MQESSLALALARRAAACLLALTEGADQAWHLGARLGLAESLNLSLEASRRSMAGADAAHDLALLATLGF